MTFGVAVAAGGEGLGALTGFMSYLSTFVAFASIALVVSAYFSTGSALPWFGIYSYE